MALDESTSDDGGIHRIFEHIPLEAVEQALHTLRRLAFYRGVVTPEVRAIAQRLADDPDWSLAEHPVVRRILEAA